MAAASAVGFCRLQSNSQKGMFMYLEWDIGEVREEFGVNLEKAACDPAWGEKVPAAMEWESICSSAAVVSSIQIIRDAIARIDVKPKA